MRHFGVVIVAVLAACGGRRVETDTTGEKPSTLVSTFIGDYLEIDETSGGGDADLLSTIGQHKPGPASASYLDWNDVNPTGHRFLDVSDPDTSSFPRSIGCVASSKVLSKMDLTYVGLANNLEYAYFAVQRANNNGDAGYYWLMTKIKPELKGVAGPCKEGESYLEYHLSPGDVLLAGHFQPSAEPLLKVFVAKQTVTVDAIAAIDFSNTALWAPDPAAIAGVAVNTSNADPGSWGAAGVNKQALVGGLLGPELFAEAAVKTSIFTNGKPCGAKFFGTVITRSSGSGGTSPDLKDFFGPEEFSFGDISAEVSLTPSCSPAFGYQATAKGIDGNTLDDAICTWTFTRGDGTVLTAADCASPTFAAPVGSYSAKVTIKDPATTCEITADAGQVSVYAPLAVLPALAGSCNLSFTYGAMATGGSGSYTTSWTFPADTTPVDGATATVTSPGAHEVSVSVKDSTTSCAATGSGTVMVYAPLGISVLAGAIPTCAAGDALTYTAAPSGGSGTATVTWTGWACAPGTSCTVNPDDDVFCMSVELQATATDPICGQASSGVQRYSKQTVVTSTAL